MSTEEEGEMHVDPPPTGAIDAAVMTLLFERFARYNRDTTKMFQDEMKKVIKDSKPEPRPERIGVVPAKFKGDKKDARRFITALELYFKGNSEIYDEEDKKLSLAFSLCEGDAVVWIQPYLSSFNSSRNLFGEEGEEEESDDEDEFKIKTFEEFVDAFCATWAAQDITKDARRRIESLKQGKGTVAEFASEFNSIAADTGYSSEDLIERFRKGLSYDIRRILGGWDRDMGTLKKLKLAAMKAEQQHEEFVGRGSWNTNSSNTNTSSRPTTSKSSSKPVSSDQGIVPMEVDAGTIVCYNCYKEGHMKKECTNDAKPWRRVVYKGASQAKKVYATQTDKPATFIQGSSRDGKSEEEGSSRLTINDVNQKIEVLSLNMAQFMDSFNQKKDF